ncbi:MAG: zinc-dependent metalloprotease [Pseudobdellovibrio sp.]
MGKQKTGITNWVVKLIAVIAFATSCTKSRDAKFAYGTGENLMSIQDFDGKEFDLKTEDEISQLSLSKSDNVTSSSASVTQHSIVKYKTSAELMDSSPFVGKKNFTYKIRYELTDNYLKLYKVAAKKDLSLAELTYAIEGEKGTFKVPLLGYPITGYYKVTRDRNDLDEQTSKLIEKSETTKDSATHFKINRQGKELFKALQKIDTFPANFFDGDWYYSETVSALNYTSQSGYGTVLSLDQFGNDAAKVRLKKTETGLSFYNLNVDDKIAADLATRDENKVTVISIPAKWKSFKQSAKGRDTSMAEEEDNSLVWNSRQFVEVDLAGASSYLANSGNFEVRDMQIDDNYFSFTTLSKTSNEKIRHSFLKAAARNYTPKTYFAEDQSIFGFFHSKKNALSDTSDRYYEKDFNTLDLVNRYNPASEKIEFHLSDASPDWVMPVAVAAVDQWNKAFKKAGIKTEVTFNKERVQLGDLRYNIINLVSQPDDAFSWGGFGPSLDDPQTGERIASTANVNVNDTTGFLIRVMRNMADAQIGLLDKAYIIGLPLPSFEAVQQTAEGESKVMLNYSRSPKLAMALQKRGDTVGLKLVEFNKASKKGFAERQLGNSLSKRGLKFKSEENIGASYGNVIADINAGCADVKSYIEGLKSTSQKASSEDEYALYSKCAKKVSGNHLLGVLLHEMGHNLGLRHNFYGSVDAANFIHKSIRTSSVMEYTTSNESGAAVGPYDIAALRWAYNSEVETTNGSVVKIDANKPIDQSLNEKSLARKPFMYCTDENVDIIGLDPMCARLDAGTTPLEVVKHYAADYNTSIALGNQRRDRNDMSNAMRLSDSRLERFLIPIKHIYDFYRIQIGLFAGKGQEYLETLDQDSYTRLLIKMNNDPKFGPILRQYSPAAIYAFEFLKDLAFTPDKYCVVQRDLPSSLVTEKNKSSLKLFNLSAIKKDIFDKQNLNVNSCQDAAVTTYLSDRKSKVIASGGYFLEDQYLDLSKSIDLRTTARDYNVQYKPDTIGMVYERANAIILLGARFRTSAYNDSLGFFPNFYDEPNFRAAIEDAVLNRLTKGIDINTFNIFDKKYDGQFYSANFLSEKTLLNFMYAFFKESLMIPGKAKINETRLSKFTLNFAINDDVIDQIEASGLETQKITILGQKYYATEKNDVTFKLLKSLSAINLQKENSEPSAEVVTKLSSILKAGLPIGENFSKYTVEAYNTLAGNLNTVSIALKKQQDSDIDFAFLNRLLAPYLRFSAVLNYYYSVNNTTVEQKGVFLKKSFSEIITAMNDFLKKSAPDMPLLDKNVFLASSVDKMVTVKLTASKNTFEIYQIDKDELDAQHELISTIILDR